jgi:hypothetical protein
MKTEDGAAMIADPITGPAMSTEAIPEGSPRPSTYAMSAHPNDTWLRRLSSEFARLKEEVDAAGRPPLLTGAFRHQALSPNANFQSL